jgi:hypothetical protein
MPAILYNDIYYTHVRGKSHFVNAQKHSTYISHEIYHFCKTNSSGNNQIIKWGLVITGMICTKLDWNRFADSEEKDF